MTPLLVADAPTASATVLVVDVALQAQLPAVPVAFMTAKDRVRRAAAAVAAALQQPVAIPYSGSTAGGR